MQLVEHVCHCNSALVEVSQRTQGYERGAQLIMGKSVAATRLLSPSGAESKTSWPIWRRAAGGGVVRGRLSKVDNNGYREKREKSEGKLQKEAQECQ